MLKKSQRLSTKEVALIVSKGKPVHSPLFTARFVNEGKDVKVGAIVPQKIAKTAVLRNKVRRQIYIAVEPLVPLLKPGILVAIFAKNDALKADVAVMAADLRTLFLKTGLVVV